MLCHQDLGFYLSLQQTLAYSNSPFLNQCGNNPSAPLTLTDYTVSCCFFLYTVWEQLLILNEYDALISNISSNWIKNFFFNFLF